MAKAVSLKPLDEVKSLKNMDTSLRQTAELLNNIGDLDPVALKKQVISLNSALEKRLVSAGRSLVKGAHKEDLPKAMSAAYLFTHMYLAHCERVDSLLKEKQLDVEAFGAELNAQFEDVYPFISTIEGMDPGLLKKLKGANAKALFRLLKDTAKKVPSEASAGFNALVSSVEKLFPKEENFALYSGLSPRIVGLGVLYFIVWLILELVIGFILLTFFHIFVAPQADNIQMRDMVRASQAISGIIILAYIFRKQLFGKKK